jgi:hypothetical protein
LEHPDRGVATAAMFELISGSNFQFNQCGQQYRTLSPFPFHLGNHLIPPHLRSVHYLRVTILIFLYLLHIHTLHVRFHGSYPQLHQSHFLYQTSLYPIFILHFHPTLPYTLYPPCSWSTVPDSRTACPSTGTVHDRRIYSDTHDEHRDDAARKRDGVFFAPEDKRTHERTKDKMNERKGGSYELLNDIHVGKK